MSWYVNALTTNTSEGKPRKVEGDITIASAKQKLWWTNNISDMFDTIYDKEERKNDSEEKNLIVDGPEYSYFP